MSRIGGNIIKAAGIILAPVILIALYLLIGEMYQGVNKDIIIQKIIDTLGGGEYDIINEWLSGNIFANPVFGSLIIAFIFGMIFSLALKQDTPIPVWIVALLVVVIAMVFGIGSWAIPITLIYISEALVGGMALPAAAVTLLLLVGGVIIIGFGIGWYIRLAANRLENAFRPKYGPAFRHRKPSSTVKIRIRRNKR